MAPKPPPNAIKETVVSVRPMSRSLTTAVNSERSRLSGAAIDFFTVLVTNIGPAFEGLMPSSSRRSSAVHPPQQSLPVRARQCLLTVIEYSQSPSVLSYFVESVKDKSVSLRLSVAECALACLNSLNTPDLEKEPRAREIEIIIRATATDASADVRKVGRKVFEAYKLVLPSRVDK
ncbi:uncharacterized protein B0H18DRAFT_1082224 [Fomitopsis serialis]|uniref:uncharacterized protein n=1 Tax=Fomitopsis serialis TaxID=139415 RepID=UPI0020083181|nr:uncharacterized protein B0H18DRAFT_1082224 [Neoantrodia serialis]KAH9935440.1 hypothetical protein B0H18DRAFT_1082224 [Neoantrodia serialis]